jgi:hypothetical protein
MNSLTVSMSALPFVMWTISLMVSLTGIADMRAQSFSLTVTLRRCGSLSSTMSGKSDAARRNPSAMDTSPS